ncbi:MAG: AMP-binding protein [Devosia sp.]|nr:AMP-binding protein [Devosia sp.]
MTTLAHWAREQGGKSALFFPGSSRRLSFSELSQSAESIAKWMVAAGLQPGEVIAFLLENRSELVELAWGARRAGLYYTPLSTHLKPREIGHVLKDCGARVLVTSPQMAELAATVIHTYAPAGLRCLVLDRPAQGFEHFEPAVQAATAASAALPPRPIGRDFLYSSGTTGLPRGIRKPMVPHERRFELDREVDVWRDTFGFGPDSVYFSPAPLYHAAPLRYVMRTIEVGGSCVVLEKFDAEQTLATLEACGVTHSQWVPTMFQRLLDLPLEIRKKYDLRHMRVAIHAAAPCPPQVKRAMIEWWGPILAEYYAGSEGIGLTTIDSTEWLAHPGSVGRAKLGALHIVDEAGAELGSGEVGRVYFSGGPRFEYFNEPAKTLEAFNDKGWATYGDLGHLDAEGYLYLSDRRADLIISGGVNVYPNEVENVLRTHPWVADAAVIGVPSRDLGEEVKAVVQLRDTADAGDEAARTLIAFCRDHLSNIKVPKSVAFEASLPRLDSGKLLRRALKEKYRTVDQASRPE